MTFFYRKYHIERRKEETGETCLTGMQTYTTYSHSQVQQKHLRWRTFEQQLTGKDLLAIGYISAISKLT